MDAAPKGPELSYSIGQWAWLQQWSVTSADLKLRTGVGDTEVPVGILNKQKPFLSGGDKIPDFLARNLGVDFINVLVAFFF